MHPWMSKIYAHKSQLWIDGAGEREHIYSEEGAQQGDPLGLFLVCAAMRQVLQRVNEVLSARGGMALVTLTISL